MRKETLLLTFLAIAAMAFVAPAMEYTQEDLREERVLFKGGTFWVYERDATPWGDDAIDVTGHLGDLYDTPHLADLNGDGLDDRIIIRWSGQHIAYCRYTASDGSLPDVGIDTQRGLGGEYEDTVMFGNFNSDGIADTMLCTAVDMLWYVRPSDGNEGLPDVNWVNLGIFGEVGDTPLYADVNGDGFDDRVVVRADGEAWTTYVDYSIDGDAGDAVQDVNVTRGVNATDIVVFSDINGDGLDDYILVRDNGDTFNLYGYYTYFDDGLSKYILGGASPDIQYCGGDPAAGTWLFGQMQVPEPTTLALLGFGAFTLIRKRK
jgi:hypothetical protein